jgi:hypothetical protein
MLLHPTLALKVLFLVSIVIDVFSPEIEVMVDVDLY